MTDSGGWIEIVFLAMLAGFIALRLVAVLGKKTGHEDAAPRYPGPSPELATPNGASFDARTPAAVAVPTGTDPSLQGALQSIADKDRSFDPQQFVGGAQSAYRHILEAFWRGDVAALDNLVSDDVLGDFKAAIDARGDDAPKNKLLAVKNAAITAARINGPTAEVTVRFDADLQPAGGETVETHDVWTFSRHFGASDPNWLLIETDDEA
jgi:predicted lipid-binding transport protein (Tim44 family)